MDKAQIEALLARIDVWLLIFGVIVVVGVAGESFFGIRHWWNSRKLQTIQRTEDQQREEQIARLNKEAGEARKTAGAADERAAALEVEALQLRKELLLQGPRANLIAGDNRKKLVDTLKPFAKQPVDVRHRASVMMVNSRIVEVTPIGDDTVSLASTLVGVLKEAGWSVPPDPLPSNLQGQGITVEIGARASHQTRAAAQALAESLRHISLAVNGPSELPAEFRKRVGEDPIQPPFGDDTIVVDVIPHP